jgi:hypothetical protein
MATKIKDLVKKLQEKDPEQVVEFVVVGTDGALVLIDIETQAHDLAHLLKMFRKSA